jgi:hypothetical protein
MALIQLCANFLGASGRGRSYEAFTTGIASRDLISYIGSKTLGTWTAKRNNFDSKKRIVLSKSTSATSARYWKLDVGKGTRQRSLQSSATRSMG